ncbi:MAG: hypothetical protein PHT37_04350 [Candidatus Cloacimonetes bacterium]|nr:hypothetical protein [Candidatus Cloacimonadota bacterium]MDD4277104.1 hypothetical protein [Candidatus Cloacimonadota bacterium]
MEIAGKNPLISMSTSAQASRKATANLGMGRLKKNALIIPKSGFHKKGRNANQFFE